MSHITQVEMEVKSLDELKKACVELGLEFHEGQTTYKCYPRPVGTGHVFPEGFSVKKDWGKCDVGAISVPGHPNAYEIGVARRRDGVAGYVLLFDSWEQGHGLMPKIGDGACKLKQEYTVQVAFKQARRMGLRGIRRTVRTDGSVCVVGAK